MSVRWVITRGRDQSEFDFVGVVERREPVTERERELMRAHYLREINDKASNMEAWMAILIADYGFRRAEYERCHDEAHP